MNGLNFTIRLVNSLLLILLGVIVIHQLALPEWLQFIAYGALGWKIGDWYPVNPKKEQADE